MSIVGKVLGLLLAEHISAENANMFNRLMANVAVILSLVILSAILASVLCMGIGYGIYFEFVSHGYDPLYVVAFMGIAIVLVLVVLIVKIKSSLEEIKKLPLLPVSRAQGIASIGRAFLDGLLNHSAIKPKPTK